MNLRFFFNCAVLLSLFAVGCAKPPQDAPPQNEPQWRATNQHIWYYAASVYADNTPYGTPMWARTVWDEIVQVDPEAPLEYRPFWVMTT